jgi:hypothetical protein
MKIKLAIILSLLFASSSCVAIRSTTSQHVFSNEKLKEISSEGKACAYSIIGLINFGDMTVDKAAKNGGINEIVFIESKTEPYPLVTAFCTIVKGR